MNFKERIKKISIPITWWTVGGISLLLVLISFAVLLPYLRFYLDDWPQMYSMKVYGLQGIKQYFLYDGRPFGYWADYLGFLAFGTNAKLWHLSLFLIRWLTAMFMWGTLVQIWPKNRTEVTWAALLFSTYPLFAQMSTSVTFTVHFLCYLLFFVSTFFMVLALRQRKYFWLFTVLSVLFDLVNIFTYEYFIGVEFLRLLMIWFILRDKQDHKVNFGKIILNWLPYLATSASFIVYRLVLIQLPNGSNTPQVLRDLFQKPLSTIIVLVQDLLKDSVQILGETWHNAFNPDLIDFTSPVLNYAWAIALITVILFLVFVYFSRNKAEEPEKKNKSFTWQALTFAFIGIVLGCAPGWAIGRTASADFGLWNDRFALASMFAAALFIVTLVNWLFDNHYWRKAVIIAFLIAIAASQNFRNENDYRWSSIYQNRFAYELSWRAPYIESPTALFADNEMFAKMGVYPTSFMLNLLYPNKQPIGKMNYWFYTLNKYFPRNAWELGTGIDVYQSHWYAKFTTNSKNSLVISYHPGQNQCVWVLTSYDLYNPDITALTKSALSATNLSRISTETTAGYPNTDLFGKENTDQWCYYFEKGDLARHASDWTTAASLYEKADQKGFTTDFGQELMPFIEAYAHLGNGDQALALTNAAAIKGDNMREYVCDNWIRIYKEITPSDSVKSAYDTIYSKYACSVIGQ
jgi:hypothetical protein